VADRPAGMTCLELERKARWRHGRASSLLHRLERAGLVQRTGEFRDDYGVYLALPLD
jgi:DNA-binding IclR family transcriptional regulator